MISAVGVWGWGWGWELGGSWSGGRARSRSRDVLAGSSGPGSAFATVCAVSRVSVRLGRIIRFVGRGIESRFFLVPNLRKMFVAWESMVGVMCVITRDTDDQVK